MLINKLNYFKIILFISLCAMIGCNSPETKVQSATVKKEVNPESGFTDKSSVVEEKTPSKNEKIEDTLKLIVVPIANGYEYAMHNNDFNPIIERELNKFENITVKPFPYKALMGVAYHGVFDKKYCPPIFEKVDVDFLILTRFDKHYDQLGSPKMKWGYELRIVKSKTLEQINTINAHNLNDYSEIEKHIKENILTLKNDIEKLN